MAFELWQPSISPHVGTSGTIDQTILEATFGDNYVQTFEDGINSVKDMVTLVWDKLALDEYVEITGFWRRKGKATPFRYQLPWEAEIKIWRFAQPCALNVPDQLRLSLSIPLKQSFDFG